MFYDFRPSRSRDGPKEVLADYRGYLQTDGYIAYTSLVREAAGRLVDVACWAHGRRGFEACGKISWQTRAPAIETRSVSEGSALLPRLRFGFRYTRLGLA